jgi:hypothetical protein
MSGRSPFTEYANRPTCLSGEFNSFISQRVSKLIAEKVGAQKLRSAEETSQSLESAGFWVLAPFRIVRLSVPWQNFVLCGRTFIRPV